MSITNASPFYLTYAYSYAHPLPVLRLDIVVFRKYTIKSRRNKNV